MKTAINKVKVIQEAALAYKNNKSLSYRKSVKLYRIAAQSVINYYIG